MPTVPDSGEKKPFLPRSARESGSVGTDGRGFRRSSTATLPTVPVSRAAQRSFYRRSPIPARPAVLVAACGARLRVASNRPVLVGAQHDPRHQRATAETRLAPRAAGARPAHAIAEALEHLAPPRLGDRRRPQLHLIAALLVEAAGDHDEVRTYVAREAPALAGVQALGRHVLAEVDDPRNGTAVEADLERVLLVELREELGSRNERYLRREIIALYVIHGAVPILPLSCGKASLSSACVRYPTIVSDIAVYLLICDTLPFTRHKVVLSANSRHPALIAIAECPVYPPCWRKLPPSFNYASVELRPEVCPGRVY